MGRSSQWVTAVNGLHQSMGYISQWVTVVNGLQQSMGYSSQWVTAVNGSQQSAFQEAGLYDVVAMLYGETTRACYFDLLSVSTMNNDP